MDKLKMHSPDLTETNIAKLAELFPNCATEAADDKGKSESVTVLAPSQRQSGFRAKYAAPAG